MRHRVNSCTVQSCGIYGNTDYSAFNVRRSVQVDHLFSILFVFNQHRLIGIIPSPTLWWAKLILLTPLRSLPVLLKWASIQRWLSWVSPFNALVVLRLNKYPRRYFRSYLSAGANVSDAQHWSTAELWISILHWLRVVLWYVNLAPFIVSIQWGLDREVGDMLWCLYWSHHSPYSHKPLLSNKLDFRSHFLIFYMRCHTSAWAK